MRYLLYITSALLILIFTSLITSYYRNQVLSTEQLVLILDTDYTDGEPRKIICKIFFVSKRYEQYILVNLAPDINIKPFENSEIKGELLSITNDMKISIDHSEAIINGFKTVPAGSYRQVVGVECNPEFANYARIGDKDYRLYRFDIYRNNKILKAGFGFRADPDFIPKQSKYVKCVENKIEGCLSELKELDQNSNILWTYVIIDDKDSDNTSDL